MPRITCSRDSKGNGAKGGEASWAACVAPPQPALEEPLVNFSTFPSRKHHVSGAPLQTHAGMRLQRCGEPCSYLVWLTDQGKEQNVPLVQLQKPPVVPLAVPGAGLAQHY